MKYCLLIAVLLLPVSAIAERERYHFDIKGQHAFIQFKIKHLGYSWLLGEFRRFDGSFIYDAENISHSAVTVVVDTRSLDSNHAERDKHLRGKDFLETEKYPEATFKSHRVIARKGGEFTIEGELEFHGVKKTIEIAAREIGRGPDPWFGFRAGFEGVTILRLSDFNIDYDLGPASTHVELQLYVEGVREPPESDDAGSEFFE